MGHETGHAGRARHLAIGDPIQSEPVDPGKRRLHLGRVLDLVPDRAGVLAFQPLRSRLQTVTGPKKPGQPVKDIGVVYVVVPDVERGLPGDLQPVAKPVAKSGPVGQHLAEFTRVEGDPVGFRVFYVRQPPLPRGRGDLAADIAVERVAREKHLGDATVGQDALQDPRVMVVEEPEPRQRAVFGDHRVHETHRITLPAGPCRSPEARTGCAAR